jgi:hypothetical protein
MRFVVENNRAGIDADMISSTNQRKRAGIAVEILGPSQVRISPPTIPRSSSPLYLHGKFRQMRFSWQLSRVRLNGCLQQLEPPRGVGLRQAAVGWL